MNINLTELLVSEGTKKQFTLHPGFETVLIDGITYELKDQGVINLTLTNLGDSEIEASGNFNINLIIPCSRCTEDVSYTLAENFVKNINLNETDEDRVHNLDEMKYIKGFNLNVDQMIYDEIVVHFPMKVLCKQDCKGICKNCGANFNKQQCNCDNVDIDPRMAVFQDILKDI